MPAFLPYLPYGSVGKVNTTTLYKVQTLSISDFMTITLILLSLFLSILELCLHDTFSASGFKPCTSCSKGTFQPHRGQIRCLPCNNDSDVAACPKVMSMSIISEE